MIGGLRDIAGRLTFATLFCVLASGVFATKPALAADLGGDCCADLEERVAELEATTVRKGNKKVSVQLYGQTNKAVLFWDDGAEKNTYVVDNNYESSRFGVKGNAKITGDWSAGYRLEIESTTAASNNVNQYNPGDDPGFGGLNVRHSYMYVNNKKMGEVRWGLTATPIYNITKDTNVTELEDTMHSDNRMNQSFFLRPQGFNTEADLSNLRWSDISRCYDSSNDFVCSTRKNGVAYWSPKWEGFSASWGFFEDDMWGGAVRYQKEWGELFEVGAGMGYEKTTDERLLAGGGGLNNFKREIQDWAGSASIKHKPTGLFVFGAWSYSDNNDSNTVHAGVFTGTSDPLMNAWDIQFGIQRKMEFLGLANLGDTSFWGGITQSNDGLGAGTNLGRIPADRFLTAGTFANVGVDTEITGSQVDRWSLAFDQAIDSAMMHVYAVYQHLSPEVDLVDSSLNSVSAPLDDFDLFYTGARIYF
jgi:predicted porin